MYNARRKFVLFDVRVEVATQFTALYDTEAKNESVELNGRFYDSDYRVRWTAK